jgi:hypothetical protein
VLAAVAGFVWLGVASLAVAHQPHVVGDAARVRVSDPEISKAYYGRLPGVPARYEIVSRRPFTLYTQITVPDIRGARRDYGLTILGPERQGTGLPDPQARTGQWSPEHKWRRREPARVHGSSGSRKRTGLRCAA